MRPLYGLATGSVLFAKDSSTLSDDEQAYYDAIAGELVREIPWEPLQHELPVEVQAEVHHILFTGLLMLLDSERGSENLSQKT